MDYTIHTLKTIDLIKYGIREVKRTGDTIQFMVGSKPNVFKLVSISNMLTKDVSIAVRVKRIGDPVCFLVFKPTVI